MPGRTTKGICLLLLGALLIPLSGCEMSCRADANDNPVEELGDKVEDATD